MEKIARVSIGVFVVFLQLPAWARALEVGMARLQEGEVRVMGTGAAREASGFVFQAYSFNHSDISVFRI